MLSLSRLRGDWWELNEQGHDPRGEHTRETLRLGDPVRARVERVETARGRIHLTPIECSDSE